MGTHRDVGRGLVGSGIAGPGNWLRDRGMPSCVRVGVSFGCVSHDLGRSMRRPTLAVIYSVIDVRSTCRSMSDQVEVVS